MKCGLLKFVKIETDCEKVNLKNVGPTFFGVKQINFCYEDSISDFNVNLFSVERWNYAHNFLLSLQRFSLIPPIDKPIRNCFPSQIRKLHKPAFKKKICEALFAVLDTEEEYVAALFCYLKWFHFILNGIELVISTV